MSTLCLARGYAAVRTRLYVFHSMARGVVSIRRRLGLSLVALISVSYGLLMVTTEAVIRRDRLQRHERLVMATAAAINEKLAIIGKQELATRSRLGEQVVSNVLNEFSATRVLVWLSLPSAPPIFPRSSAVQGFLNDPKLLLAAGLNAPGMQKPRIFTYRGETYFTCSMPLGNGQGVLRFLEDVGISPASRQENLITLLAIWLMLVLIAALLIRSVTALTLNPLLGLERVMDDLSLSPSGVVGGERVSIDGQPQELQGIVASFNALADRLQKAWTQQNLLMRSMSHELLTPVTLIGSNARRLARLAGDLPADQRQLVGSLQEEAGRINRLVSSLLDLARGDSNNLSLQSKPLIPYRLLQQAYADVQALPWGSRVQWQDLDQADPAVNATVHGDADRLRQCVLNVLENASKYSQSDQPIYLLIDSTPELVRIRVEDRGPGIPEAERELVFEPFYRSNLTTGQEVRGTGVGLAIVRLLIEKMGGKVMIVDQEQPGTTIQFELPISHDHS